MCHRPPPCQETGTDPNNSPETDLEWHKIAYTLPTVCGYILRTASPPYQWFLGCTTSMAARCGWLLNWNWINCGLALKVSIELQTLQLYGQAFYCNSFCTMLNSSSVRHIFLLNKQLKLSSSSQPKSSCALTADLAATLDVLGIGSFPLCFFSSRERPLTGAESY